LSKTINNVDKIQICTRNTEARDKVTSLRVVPAAVLLRIHVTTCRLVNCYRRFEWTFLPHFQGLAV